MPFLSVHPLNCACTSCYGRQVDEWVGRWKTLLPLQSPPPHYPILRLLCLLLPHPPASAYSGMPFTSPSLHLRRKGRSGELQRQPKRRWGLWRPRYGVRVLEEVWGTTVEVQTMAGESGDDALSQHVCCLLNIIAVLFFKKFWNTLISQLSIWKRWDCREEKGDGTQF